MWSIIVILFVTLKGISGGKFGGRSSGTHSSPHYSNTAYHSNAHTYPTGTGLSGHSRPQNSYHSTHYNQKTEVHHHYHYSPPNHVTYGSTSYPVYHSQPPVYVYEYRNSGSRFDNLLAGLALYNLGRMSADHHHYDSNREYRGHSGEICKLGISKVNGDYEETKIDCRLMSSFIWEAEAQKSRQNVVTSNTVTTVNNTQVTEEKSNGTVTTSVKVETSVVDALQVKGPSMEVTQGMKCFMIRSSRDGYIKKSVECGVLQAYAKNSLHYSRAYRKLSNIALIFVTLMHFLH